MKGAGRSTKAAQTPVPGHIFPVQKDCAKMGICGRLEQSSGSAARGGQHTKYSRRHNAPQKCPLLSTVVIWGSSIAIAVSNGTGGEWEGSVRRCIEFLL